MRRNESFALRATTSRALRLLAAGLLMVASVSAAPDLDASAAFQKLKELAGAWEGTTNSADGPPVQVQFRVTSGGSAVMETQFPGTDHEMISLYHLDSGRLVLTHYCAMGNQPHMELNAGKSNETELVFDFTGGGNLDASKDMHVHSGCILFREAGRLESDWDIYQGSQPAGSNKFFLSRQALPQ